MQTEKKQTDEQLTQTVPETPPTPEEIQRQSDEVIQSFFTNNPPKKKEEKPEPASESPKDEKPPEPEKPTPSPEEPQPAAGLEPAPAEPDGASAVPIDEDEVVERVVERLDSRKSGPAVPVETPPDPLAAFKPEDRRYLQVVQHLATTNPAYANRVNEVTAFWKKEEDYIARWERDNPGEPFNDSDPAHAAFYKQEPKIPEQDFNEALVDLRVAEKTKKFEEVENESKEVKAQLAEIRAREEEKKVLPIIKQEEYKAEQAMVIEAHPAFKDLLEDGKITKAAANKMRETDPEAFAVLTETSKELKPLISELERITNLRGYKLDQDKEVIVNGRRMYPVREILAIGTELEQSMLAKPPREQMKDGRRFIPRGELSARIRSIQEEKTISPEQKAQRVNTLIDKVWVIEDEDIKREIIGRSAQNAKRTIDLLNTRATRLTAKPAPATSSAEPESSTIKTAPPSPAVPGSVSDNVNTQKQVENPEAQRKENTMRAFFS